MRVLRAGHGEEGVGAPDKAGRGAQRHQRIHVGGAVDQALEAADEELLVDDHDDARQQQLNKAHGDVGAVEPVGECPIEKYIRTMRKISEAMSRFFNFGVSLSASASRPALESGAVEALLDLGLAP